MIHGADNGFDIFQAAHVWSGLADATESPSTTGKNNAPVALP